MGSYLPFREVDVVVPLAAVDVLGVVRAAGSMLALQDENKDTGTKKGSGYKYMSCVNTELCTDMKQRLQQAHMYPAIVNLFHHMAWTSMLHSTQM